MTKSHGHRGLVAVSAPTHLLTTPWIFELILKIAVAAHFWRCATREMALPFHRIGRLGRGPHLRFLQHTWVTNHFLDGYDFFSAHDVFLFPNCGFQVNYYRR